MYVKRLIEFAEAHPKELVPLGFKKKKMQWVADIDKGKINLIAADQKIEIVPDVARSSGMKPILLVDKADYVFGASDEKKHEKRSKERHQAYLDLLESYLHYDDDQDIQLLYKCLENHDEIACLLQKHEVKMNEHIYFRIRGDEYLHEKPKVRQFWEKHIEPQSKKASEDLICMYCGEVGPVMERHTINFLIGPDRTKLISANENAYESHGLKNSQIAPTCYRCEQKYGKALEYLLTPHKGKLPGGPHMFRLGDLTFVHWIHPEGRLQGDFGVTMNPQNQGENDMKRLLNEIFKGEEGVYQTKNFCILTLSANKGRLVVQDYTENDAADLKANIQRFFNAQEGLGVDRYYGIYALASTMYIDATKQMQKYVLKEWMNWFLHGTPLSDRILWPLLKQIQVDGTMYPNQAAAVNSCLVSKEKQKGEEDMHIQERSEAYKIGKLFAVLEKIQKEAINSNNTIATKYFSAASTTPASIIGILIKNAQHHLTKIGNSETGMGLAVYYDKKITEIYGEIEAYPPLLNATGQAEFAMGYYHEKKDLYTPKNKEEGDAQDEFQTTQ